MAANILEESFFVLTKTDQPLHDSVRQALENYVAQFKKDEIPTDLYQLILAEVEVPLIVSVMQYTRDNQSQAASILGLSRGTLRKKLKTYAMIDQPTNLVTSDITVAE